MPSTIGNSRPLVRQIDFDRTKYGAEILIDVARVSEMPSFLIDEPHALTFHDIMLVTRGRGSFWLDGHEYRVRAGAMFFTSPGQVRRWRVRGLDGICLFFPALFLEEFFSDAAFLHRLPYVHASFDKRSLHFPPRASAAVRRRLLAMQRELKARRPDSVHLLRAGLYEALITFARAYATQYRVPSERAVHPMVLDFLARVDRQFRREHRVASYASELGVSPGHLSALCRRYLGRSAKSVIRQRIDVEARRMLLFSADSAESVGYALGFGDPSYFSRFFRAATGRSPSAFRLESRHASQAR